MKKKKIFTFCIILAIILSLFKCVNAEKIENSEVGVNSNDELIWKITHPLLPILPEEKISLNVSSIDKVNNKLVLNASVNVYNTSEQWESEIINKSILQYNYTTKYVELERQLEMMMTRGRIMVLIVPIPLNLSMIGTFINTTSFAKTFFDSFNIDGNTLILHLDVPIDPQDYKMTFNNNGILENGEIISNGMIIHQTILITENIEKEISYGLFFPIPFIIALTILIIRQKKKFNHRNN